jgi:murein DD-endopeptidase MepM/ murein hydrolase activator NlpD
MTLNSPVNNYPARDPAAPSAAGSLTQARPFAVCPVDRPRSYVDDFGDARWVGGFHRHQGIDILAPLGTPVRAPFDGTASESSSWAGGLTVKIEGRLGFVYNAHLSRTGKMGKVRAGDVVGYVGNSGDARGGSTHDHFEWHPRAGAAVDSFRYLNAVCKAPAWRPIHHRWLIV